MEQKAVDVAVAPATLPPVTRRQIFRDLYRWIGWGSLATFLGGFTAGALRFFFPNVLYEPPTAFKIGRPDEYNDGVDLRFKDKFRVWIVKTKEGMYAFEARCTHLGC